MGGYADSNVMVIDDKELEMHHDMLELYRSTNVLMVTNILSLIAFYVACVYALNL
jgi:hypothetical protein